MTQRLPSLPQRFFKAIFPRSWGADMEAESRKWMVRCPCGHAKSMWELGGIRWRAAGRPRMLRKCPSCGKRTWHVVAKEDAPRV